MVTVYEHFIRSFIPEDDVRHSYAGRHKKIIPISVHMVYRASELSSDFVSLFGQTISIGALHIKRNLHTYKTNGLLNPSV